jgi:N utilization substance protein B
MRMALSEFLYFPSIPIKVTINEYLDIAKEYSTPKSKDFINGVLDALMKDLKDKNLLNKTGRGLL